MCLEGFFNLLRTVLYLRCAAGVRSVTWGATRSEALPNFCTPSFLWHTSKVSKIYTIWQACVSINITKKFLRRSRRPNRET